MPVSATTLRKLMEAGILGDALIDIIASIDADHAMAPATKERTPAALRQERYRQRQASQNVTSDVTVTRHSDVTCDVTPPSSSPKKVSPTPPSKNNPSTIPGSTSDDVSQRASDDVETAYADWNVLAKHCNLPQAETLNAKRRASLRQRLKECGGIDGWRDALRLIPKSEFLMGDNNSGFTATLDFVLQASSFTKLREGNYAKRGNGPAGKPLKGLALVNEQLRQEISDAGYGGEENPDNPAVQRLAFGGSDR